MPSVSEPPIDPYGPALTSGSDAAAPAVTLQTPPVTRLSGSGALSRPGTEMLLAMCCVISAGLHYSLFIGLIWISTLWFRQYEPEFSGVQMAVCIDSSFSEAGSQSAEPIEFTADPLDTLLDEPHETDPARTMAVRQERVEPAHSVPSPDRLPQAEPLDLDHRSVEQTELARSDRGERIPRANDEAADIRTVELPPVERTVSATAVSLQTEPVRMRTARTVPEPVEETELPEAVAVAIVDPALELLNSPAPPIELATTRPVKPQENQTDGATASMASQATPQNLGTRRTPVQAQYTPAPQYPADSVRLREEGRVLLRVIITSGGRVSSARVVETSGFSRLDDAAVEAVANWRFSAAKDDDQPVASSVLLPIRFRL